MPQNNLRIISTNLIDDTAVTLAVSSTATANTTAANLRNDTKASTWKTGNSNGQANMVLSFSSQQVGGVAVPFSNLSSTATIRVRAFTGTTPTLGGTLVSPTVSTAGATTVYDTGTISACPYASYATPSVSNFSYGTSRMARAWFPTNVTCTSVVVEIVDSANTFVEIGKMVVGSFWSPIYNTSFGLGINFQDMSIITRVDSGNRVAQLAPRYKTMTFDLKWLNDSDRQSLRLLLQRNGVTVPILVSLFPQLQQVGTAPTTDEYDLENTYSIYGGLANIQALTHSTFKHYSSSMELEEI